MEYRDTTARVSVRQVFVSTRRVKLCYDARGVIMYTSFTMELYTAVMQ